MNNENAQKDIAILRVKTEYDFVSWTNSKAARACNGS
jgi:hypothetical protein